jgi:hypothetical protein
MEQSENIYYALLWQAHKFIAPFTNLSKLSHSEPAPTSAPSIQWMKFN